MNGDDEKRARWERVMELHKRIVAAKHRGAEDRVDGANQSLRTALMLTERRDQIERGQQLTNGSESEPTRLVKSEQSEIASRGSPPTAQPPLRTLVRKFTASELQTEPDPRAFAWAPWVPAARVSVLVGAGGTSKSSLAVRLAVATVLGEPLFGGETTMAAVLYVSAEDRRADLHRHLFEAMRGRTEADAGMIGRQFHPLDCNGLDVKLVRLIDRAAVVTQQARELAEVAREADAGLVILDTCSRLNGAGEDNEGLARMIEAGELIAREADSAVLVVHHVGKAQMRDKKDDQYGGRGGSAMSDNARSVLHLAVATDPRRIPVADADLLVPAREVLVLSHVKSNYATPALPVYLHRQPGAYAARLVQLPVVTGANGTEALWAGLARWLATQKEVVYPNRSTIDGLDEIGTRSTRRRALDYALERGLVVEHDHPKPRGRAKTYLALAPPVAPSAAAYREASGG